MGGRGAVAELGEDDAAFLVDGAGEHAIAVDDGVVDIGERTARPEPAGVMDGGAAGDLKSGSATRPRPMVGGVARARDVAVAEPDLVRGDQDSAPKAPGAKLDWGEQVRKSEVRRGLGAHIVTPMQRDRARTIAVPTMDPVSPCWTSGCRGSVSCASVPGTPDTPRNGPGNGSACRVW